MQQFPNPQAVFRYFTELSAIPHGSGNTAGIRQWALDTAAKLNLPAEADETGNVIIRKTATPGYEDHDRVIIQGHLDMVCAQTPDCSKNMETEGLDLIWGEEFLSADSTTLGGDDGIAIAYAFAILESDTIPHPPLTVILTVDEETGMNGATGLSPDVLDSRYLINIDSEAEGIFTVGCAGGIRVRMQLPVVRTDVQNMTKITVQLSGLTGGHSGVEIHKPLLNANMAMSALLVSPSFSPQLLEWQGGIRDNVIPTDCTAVLVCNADEAGDLCAAIREKWNGLKKCYPLETNAVLNISTAPAAKARPLTVTSTQALFSTLCTLPNGVQMIDPKLHMPETSLNIGIMELTNDCFQINTLVRSGVNAEKEKLAKRLISICEQACGGYQTSGDYPAWEYKPDTRLESVAVEAFRQQYGKDPLIQTIHAGLECGILSAKASQLECISIGPDILDIHTPRERLSLSSTERTWSLLLAILQAL